MTNWTPGDISGNQNLTDNDHLYPEHINELRTATNLRVVKVNPVGSTSDYLTDVVNIQAAIDSSDMVVLGEGDFYLGGKNGDDPYYLLLITESKKIIGSGMGRTKLIISPDVDNVTDIFRIAPIAYTPTGMEISGFSINPQATICARHAIHIDLTDTLEGGLSNFNLNHVSFYRFFFRF